MADNSGNRPTIDYVNAAGVVAAILIGLILFFGFSGNSTSNATKSPPILTPTMIQTTTPLPPNYHPLENEQMPSYLLTIQSVLSWLYMYLALPVCIIVSITILGAYSFMTIFEDIQIDRTVRFSRAIAFIFPFLLSLYLVLANEIYKLAQFLQVVPFWLLLLIGFGIGFMFSLLIAGLDRSQEVFIRLSCFVASIIMFSILTVFAIIRSFEVLNMVFGFLFGICLYVLIYGLNPSSLPKIRKIL